MWFDVIKRALRGESLHPARHTVIFMGAVLLAGVAVAAFVCLPMRAGGILKSGSDTTQGGLAAEYIDGAQSNVLSGIAGAADVMERLKEDLNQKNIESGKYTIVLDAGHGGTDPGKTNGDVLEKDINLSITLKLESILADMGYGTRLTRTSDEGLYSASDVNKKRADLKKRCDIANSADADIMVSIHQNSFSSAAVRGAQVFYYTYSANGRQLANVLQTALRTNLDSTNTRTEKDDKSYYLLLHSKIPTVIVECGFLTNTAELALLLDAQYQLKVAESVALGINEYFSGK